MMKRIDPLMDNVQWVATSKEPAFCETKTSAAPDYDLVVIGAGLCGLSIALHAAEQGLSVALLEAGTIGCGASGRNGGIAVPHFPGGMTAEDLEPVLGKKRTDQLTQLVAAGPTFVFDQIRQFEIRCDAEQKGWIQPAHSKSSLNRIDRVYQSWRARGIEAEWLDPEKLSAQTGASGYLGGWYGKAGGTLNPYALVQGLARVASERGVHIRQYQDVVDVRTSKAFKIVSTANAEYCTKKVVFATNGYTPSIYPGLAQSVIPIRLFHCLTRPLTQKEQSLTLPTQIPFTDLRKSGGFTRYDVDGRLLAGGAVFRASDVRAYGVRHVQNRIGEIFPHLKGIEIDKYWEGYCALTDASLPAIQRLDDNVYSVIGFSTRGVVLTQTLGREVAMLLAETKSEADMPVHVGPIERIALQPVKTYFGGFAFPVFQAKDRLGLS